MKLGKVNEFRPTKCSRCGGAIYENWEDRWPIFGEIKLGLAASLPTYMIHGKYQFNDVDEMAIIKELKCIENIGFQNVDIVWHNSSLPPTRWQGLSQENGNHYGNIGHLFSTKENGNYCVTGQEYKNSTDWRHSEYYLCKDCQGKLLNLLYVFLVGINQRDVPE